jgi:hypothetical protein
VTEDKDAKLVVYGDKVRGQMQRFAPQTIQMVFTDVGKKVGLLVAAFGFFCGEGGWLSWSPAVYWLTAFGFV